MLSSLGMLLDSFLTLDELAMNVAMSTFDQLRLFHHTIEFLGKVDLGGITVTLLKLRQNYCYRFNMAISEDCLETSVGAKYSNLGEMHFSTLIFVNDSSTNT